MYTKKRLKISQMWSEDVNWRYHRCDQKTLIEDITGVIRRR